MDGESFAQYFINSYGIPELVPETDSFTHTLHWTYTSVKGFKITISQYKGIIIEKVASSQERKFD
jgi:hypothetical protein